MGDGLVVPFVEQVKSLGVTLDSKLNWEMHITSIEKKVNRVLYTLRFIRHCTTETLRQRLVQALITPHFNYCSTVYLDAGTGLRARLQRLNSKGLRYIFGVRTDNEITPFRRKLGWLRVDTRKNYFMAILIYKILRMKQPTYLFNIFNVHKYTLKDTARGGLQTKELLITHVIKGRGASSFLAQGVKCWNSLTATLRFLPSLNQFKTALHKHLFTLDS